VNMEISLSCCTQGHAADLEMVKKRTAMPVPGDESGWQTKISMLDSCRLGTRFFVANSEINEQLDVTAVGLFWPGPLFEAGNISNEMSCQEAIPASHTLVRGKRVQSSLF